jgi:serine/threonine protein kinase/Tol biopolymer transport system component
MIGTTLSHYSITDKLGQGGMGEVYKAQDTNLKRTIALKVLPATSLTSDDERARFFREAQAAAQLTHPNICHVYQIDVAAPIDPNKGETADREARPFIAMEFVDGETLASRITRGPMKLEQATRIGVQIARALGAAHEAGIVHRDMKSANVMLTAKGDEVKVLDFGLAKTAQSTKLTKMGSTLGTTAYMSPEQARGEEVDRRTDIWSLGVVLYEMITGKVPFSADYDQVVLYSIMNEDPEPLTAVRTGVPQGLEWIVNKCLSKDPTHRYQSAAELVVDLETVDLTSPGISRVSSASTQKAAPRQRAARQSFFLPAALAVAALVVGLIGGWFFWSSPPADSLVRHVSVHFKDLEDLQHPSLSPRGRYLAFTAREELRERVLYLYDFTTGITRPLTDPGDMRLSAFSPDGRWLAFEKGLMGISRVRVPDGSPVRLLEFGANPVWMDNSTVLFTHDHWVSSVDIRTGAVSVLVDTASLPPGQSVEVPYPVPGTDYVLVSVNHPGRRYELGILDRGTGSVSLLGATGYAPRFVPSGHVTYVDATQTGGFGGTVLLQPFDRETGTFTGPGTPILGARGFWEYAVGLDGSLLATGPLTMADENEGYTLFWADTVGRYSTPLNLTPRDYDQIDISPDGKWLATNTERGEPFPAIWVAPLDAPERALPLNFQGIPIRIRWAPDSKHILYSTFDGGSTRSWRRLADGSDPTVLETEDILADISSDGRMRAIIAGHMTETNLYVEEVETGIRRPIDTSAAAVFHAEFSPDDRFIVHEAVSEDFWEIWIRSLSGLGSWRVSIDRGTPSWAPDGRSLYLRTNYSLFRIDLDMTSGIRPTGTAEHIYTGPPSFSYTVHPKTGRVLIAAPSSPVTGEYRGRIDLVLNWSKTLGLETPGD